MTEKEMLESLKKECQDKGKCYGCKYLVNQICILSCLPKYWRLSQVKED